jgi:hypothetical protein
MHLLKKFLFLAFLVLLWLDSAAAVPLQIQVQVTHPTCAGLCDGKVKLIVTGGQPGYMFQWSNGLRSENYYDACAGKGTVTVKDIGGNTTTAEWELKDPPPIGIDRLQTRQPTAGQSDGRIEIEVTGGLLPYQFSLDGEKFSTSNIFNGLAPGSYVINIKDTNGCNVQSGSVVLEVANKTLELKSLYHLTYNEEKEILHLYSNVPLYMQLIDLVGRKIQDEELSKGHDVFMDNLDYGVYFLKVTDGMRTSYEKIVKK